MQDSGIWHELLVKEVQGWLLLKTENIRERVEHLQRSFIQPVVNATGVLLHTNLEELGGGDSSIKFSSNIEFNLETE